MNRDDRELDHAFRRVQAGDHEAFSAWLGMVEIPLRRSLRSFARAVDAEAVMQEGLLRMWRGAPTLQLGGPNASLRYALVLVRRLALEEARRLRRVSPLELEDLERLPEGRVDPDPPPDPGLRRAIADCIEKLPPQPRRAIAARIETQSLLPDRDLAARLSMKLNTFLQNIVRARRLLADCLEGRGVRLCGLAP